MTTRITLLCHAATAATRKAAFPADEPLEPQALVKLAAMSRDLAGADRYVTSPALRAIQTAQALHLDAFVEPLLRDCDYGRWAGLQLDDVQANDPNGFAAWLGNLDAVPPGGEPLAALITRVEGWLDACAASGARIMAVTHPAVIKAAVMLAIGAPPRAFWRIDVAPLSTTRLTETGGRWTLAALNG